MSSSIELMSHARLKRSLRRIALEIIEQQAEQNPLILFGVNERGFYVAERIAHYLAEFSSLETSPIRVDANHNELTASDEKISTDNCFVVVVDDVIFSGTTMREALDLIDDLGKPASIHIATLVDRGHRRYPIEPDFTGMNHPTKLDEHVEVRISDDHANVLLYNA